MRLKTVVLFIAVLCFPGVSSWGRVFMSRQAALKLAFPSASSVDRKTVFLSQEQAAAVQKLAKSKAESQMVTYYVGKSTGGVLGYAFFETHIVRTMPETFMAVVDPDGTLKFVELLAFYEPGDYLSPKRWFALFGGRKLDDELWVKRGIRNVTGATLSAQAVTDGIRRVLAFFQIAIKKEIK